MSNLRQRLITLLEPNYLQLSYCLCEIVSSYDSLLDLGGGSGTAFGNFTPACVGSRVVVDQHEKSLEIGLRTGVYTQAFKQDLLEFIEAQPSKSFDVVMATSVIEHFSKEAGAHLANEMKRVAKHIALLYTPNGFVPQPPTRENPHQEHLSGWNSHDLETLGYEFAGGFNGLKYLRTTHGALRFKPKFIALPFTLSTARFTRRSKHFAFEILHVAKSHL